MSIYICKTCDNKFNDKSIYEHHINNKTCTNRFITFNKRDLMSLKDEDFKKVCTNLKAESVHLKNYFIELLMLIDNMYLPYREYRYKNDFKNDLKIAITDESRRNIHHLILTHGEYVYGKELVEKPLIYIKPFNVISLFSGMGGMDIGFAEQVIVHKASILSKEYIDSDNKINGFVNLKRLPFNIVLQNDILKSAKKIAEFNNWDHNYILKDVRDLIKDSYKFPKADVIIGGFPCQDFSHAGNRKGFDSDRGTLYKAYVEIVKRVKPIIFVAENVQGLLTMPNNAIQIIIDDFAAVGYEVKYQLIKCEEFGIPQTRHRVIIMGIRLDYRSKLDVSWNIITENKISCPIKNYFDHLEEPEISDDLAQQSFSKAARLAKGQGQTVIKIDGFAPTMRAEHHGNIEFRHINKDINKDKNNLRERRLSVREAALIQTFSPNSILTDDKTTNMAYKPIGNAVPPLLGYIIACKVEQILEKCKK